MAAERSRATTAGRAARRTAAPPAGGPLASHVETFELGPRRVTARFVEAGEPRGECADVGHRDCAVDVAAEPFPGAPAEAPAVVPAYR